MFKLQNILGKIFEVRWSNLSHLTANYIYFDMVCLTNFCIRMSHLSSLKVRTWLLSFLVKNQDFIESVWIGSQILPKLGKQTLCSTTLLTSQRLCVLQASLASVRAAQSSPWPATVCSPAPAIPAPMPSSETPAWPNFVAKPTSTRQPCSRVSNIRWPASSSKLRSPLPPFSYRSAVSGSACSCPP